MQTSSVLLLICTNLFFIFFEMFYPNPLFSLNGSFILQRFTNFKFQTYNFIHTSLHTYNLVKTSFLSPYSSITLPPSRSLMIIAGLFSVRLLLFCYVCQFILYFLDSTCKGHIQYLSFSDLFHLA